MEQRGNGSRKALTHIGTASPLFLPQVHPALNTKQCLQLDISDVFHRDNGQLPIVQHFPKAQSRDFLVQYTAVLTKQEHESLYKSSHADHNSYKLRQNETKGRTKNVNKIHNLDYYPVPSILISVFSEQESTTSMCPLKILLFCSKYLRLSESGWHHAVTVNNYYGGAKCLNKKQEGTKHSMNLYCSMRNEQQYTQPARASGQEKAEHGATQHSPAA